MTRVARALCVVETTRQRYERRDRGGGKTGGEATFVGGEVFLDRQRRRLGIT